MKLHLLRFALPIVMLMTSGLASASETFPPLIQQLYELDRDPECTLCHSTIEGGDNTITTKFGKNMEARGVRGKVPTTLDRALRAAAREYEDSDGDEATDYFELRSGTDPNDERDVPELGVGGGAGQEVDFGDIPELPPLAEHGCALARPSSDSGLAPLALLFVWALRRRRRAART